MRYIFNDVVTHLRKKMVFIGGPRQVGKTTLAKFILRYYAERLKPKRAVQIVSRVSAPFDKDGIRVTDPLSYFRGLQAPDCHTPGIGRARPR
jgi:predicted AAA+ superfamily ATPase